MIEDTIESNRMPQVQNALVVEDAGMIALTIEKGLNELGYSNIEICHTGHDALAFVKKQSFDLIMMDIRLRGDWDGIETATRILKLKPHPILFLTAFSDKEIIERAKTIRPIGFITKPFTQNDLKIALGIGMSRYITRMDLEQRESKLRQSNEELKQSLSVKNNELRDMSKVIGEKQENIENFVQLIYHDMQEPIRLIANYFSLLTDNLDFDGVQNEEDQIYLQFIRKGVKDAQDHIFKLKKFSSVMNSPPKLKRIKLKNVVLQSIENELKHVLDDDRRISQTIKNNLLVRADETQLEILFATLLLKIFQEHQNSKKIMINIFGELKSDIVEIEIRQEQARAQWNFISKLSNLVNSGAQSKNIDFQILTTILKNHSMKVAFEYSSTNTNSLKLYLSID